MKKLLIILMLISPFSFADWDDVYYCQMITNKFIEEYGEDYSVKLHHFKFSMEEKRQAMIFDSRETIWKNQMFPVASLTQSAEGMVFETKPRWAGTSADNFRSTFNYDRGKLFGVAFWGASIVVIVADCDKLE